MTSSFRLENIVNGYIVLTVEVEPDLNDPLLSEDCQNNTPEQVSLSSPEYKTTVERRNNLLFTDFYDTSQEAERGHALTYEVVSQCTKLKNENTTGNNIRRKMH